MITPWTWREWILTMMFTAAMTQVMAPLVAGAPRPVIWLVGGGLGAAVVGVREIAHRTGRWT